MRNYNRQAVFNQEKLEEAKITIVGAGSLTNYLCLYLSGLGIRNVTVIDNTQYKNNDNEFLLKDFKGPNVEGLEKKIKEMNPDIKVTSINNPLSDFLIGHPDVLVDLTNNPESKKTCKQVAKSIKSIKKVISASSSENNGSIITYDISNKSNGPLIFNPLSIEKGSKKPQVLTIKKDNFLEEYKNFSQGSFTSGLVSAIVLDEIRKVVAPLDKEHPLEKRFDFSLYSQKRFNSGIKFDEKKEDLSKFNVLVVGAGGIGTYVCLNLSLMGVGNIELYDGDVIEDHNLNRQVFYYDAIGKKKAEVLAERLNKIRRCINPHPSYLKDVSRLKKYDLIFSCLDNWEYRFMLNDYAVKNHIPFINGSVSTFDAYAEFCNCLSCKYNAEKKIESEKNLAPKAGSCSNIENSNVVMTNAFIGAIMAAEAKALIFPKKYQPLYKKELRYNSTSIDSLKFSTSDQVLSCLCDKKLKGCECHEAYNSLYK